MKRNAIYKKDSKGGIRFWQAEIDGGKWRTISGLVNGNPTISAWVECKPKSKATVEEQAESEALSAETKKLREDYRASIEELATSEFRIKPMLAEKYEGFFEGKKPGVFCISQPKLDGIRCLMTPKGPFTREGLPILVVDHLYNDLKPFFEACPDVVALDGELYNHEFRDNFNRVASLVRKERLDTVTDEDWGEIYEKVEYHVYDVILQSNPVFLDRWEWLQNSGVGGAFTFVDTFICNSQEELDEDYKMCDDKGYEGQIVRTNAPYEFKRSKNLLKRKENVSEEYRVLDILEGTGNWAKTAKVAVCYNHHCNRPYDPSDDKTFFGATLNGTWADNLKYLEKKAYYIDGLVTVRRFAKLTPDSVPRFPVATDFHPHGRLD